MPTPSLQGVSGFFATADKLSIHIRSNALWRAYNARKYFLTPLIVKHFLEKNKLHRLKQSRSKRNDAPEQVIVRWRRIVATVRTPREGNSQVLRLQAVERIGICCSIQRMPKTEKHKGKEGSTFLSYVSPLQLRRTFGVFTALVNKRSVQHLFS